MIQLNSSRLSKDEDSILEKFCVQVFDFPMINSLQSNDASIFLFADDTTLIVHEENYDSLISECNSVLTKFRDWTHANSLSLNVDKTFSMLYTDKQNQTRRIFFLYCANTRTRRMCLSGS